MTKFQRYLDSVDQYVSFTLTVVDTSNLLRSTYWPKPLKSLVNMRNMMNQANSFFSTLARKLKWQDKPPDISMN